MPERLVRYAHDGLALEGVLTFSDAASGPLPTVLVCHGMEGRSTAQLDFARRLTQWGHAGFAADLFGIESGDMDAGQRLMSELRQDRDLLRRRMVHLLGVVRDLPEVDADRIAAAGFCFGGLCVLDLARSGADVRGVASFHGVLEPPDSAPDKISAKVIVFHGWDDPFAPPDDVVALGRELSAAGADWQIHAYGGAMHAFMAPTANNPEAGIMHHPRAARRAVTSLRPFLDEAFS